MVTPYVSAVYGGPARSVTETCAALGRAGLDVDLVTTDANGARPLDLPQGDWISHPSHRMRVFPLRPRRGPFLSRALASWVSREARRYDVVHAQMFFNHPAHVAAAAARRAGVPYVITPRGTFEPWALKHKGLKKRAYLAWTGKRLMAGAAAVQALAPKEAVDVIAAVPGARVITIPNGVSQAELDAPLIAGLFWERFPSLIEKRLILFLSRVHQKKGLDVLAAAFGAVHREFPEAHVVVAGPDDGYEATARRLFAEAGCSESVSFVGMLDGALKRAALAAAEIYVLPSYSEGFSMSVLEAMAAAKPCVITHGCNFPEAATAGAAHVVAAESEPIGNALLACLRSPGDAKQMGVMARQFVRTHYTWEIVATDLAAVYQGIVRNPGGAGRLSVDS